MKRTLLFLFLCVMFVATTFGWDLSLAPGLSVKNAFLYSIILIYMVETAVFRNRRLELPSVIVPFCLLLAYCILSWATVSFVFQPVGYRLVEAGIALKTNGIDQLMFFLVFFYGLTSRDEALSFLRVFLWILVIGNAITVIDAFNIPDLGLIQQREDGRLGGPMGESNQYGALLALTLPAIIAQRWDPGTKKWLVTIASFVSILALLIASSRGSFVAILLGCIFSIYYLRASISLRHAALGLLAAIIVAVIMATLLLGTDLGADLVERFTNKLSGNLRTMSSGRTRIWLTALQQMSESPWSFFVGFGWEAYEYINRIGVNTHNVYLNYLFNLGLPGLALYVVLIVNLFVACSRSIPKADGALRNQLIAFVFGFSALCVALFFVDLYKAWNWVWAYTGLVMRLAVIAGQDYSAGTVDNGPSLSVGGRS